MDDDRNLRVERIIDCGINGRAERDGSGPRLAVAIERDNLDVDWIVHVMGAISGIAFEAARRCTMIGISDGLLMAISASLGAVIVEVLRLLGSRGATSAQAAQEWRELHNANKAEIEKLKIEIKLLNERIGIMEHANVDLMTRIALINENSGQFLSNMMACIGDLQNLLSQHGINKAVLEPLTELVMVYGQFTAEKTK